MSPSMFGLFAAGLAAFAPLASAYTTPTGTEPKGNPISQPGLNTIVPVDQDFTITWQPTTEGTVSLVLLKGPADNLIPVYAIAEKIENSGSYTWDPKDTLEPSEGAKGYGIQLIDDKTGQYQYTTQFGISNKDYKQAEAPSSYAAAAPSSYAAASSVAASSAVSSAVSSVIAPVHSATSDIIHSTTSVPVAAPVTTSAAPYSIPHNTTAPHATGILSFSTGSTAKPTGGNTTSVEPSTGSASNMAASLGGLVLAAGVAVFAL